MICMVEGRGMGEGEASVVGNTQEHLEEGRGSFCSGQHPRVA